MRFGRARESSLQKAKEFALDGKRDVFPRICRISTLLRAMEVMAVHVKRVVFAFSLVMLLHAVSGLEYGCEGKGGYPFCERGLPLSARVEDLVSRLTTREKIELLGNSAAGVPRLGIPKYEWWNEALHGVAYSPGVTFDGYIKAATSFPQPILTAASFNVSLFNKIAQVIATEARALRNSGQSGLTFWTPNINIFRDPRWGRGQESPGEDPLLTARYAEYFVRGLQEGDYDGNSSSGTPEKLKASACCKHFAAYDLESWEGVERYGFDAQVTKQDLYDTFNPPFQGCIERGRASGLMCSYNQVNGVPTCADSDLLNKTARGLWKFDGYIVSDCDAVEVIYANTKYETDPIRATADVLKAGMDLNCGNTLLNYTASALSKNLLQLENIDTAVGHSLSVQFRLGLFDGNPTQQLWGDLTESDVCSDEHQNLALEAAAQGIVLLQNNFDILPLVTSEHRSLAVIGPTANDSLHTMLGNYAGEPCQYVTPTQGLAKHARTVHYVAGCANTSCESADLETAANAAAHADAVVLVVGLGQDQEREALDRTSLLLPGKQQDLINAVVRAAKGPVILVVVSGGPVDVTDCKADKRIGAILWAGYPGQLGGDALADIIYGVRNPSGKLPMTWYPRAFTDIPMTAMNMRPDASKSYPGRTYRFYNRDTVYEFGDGLTYSNFTHSFIGSGPVTLVAPPAAQQLCSDDGRGCSDADVAACSAQEFTVEVAVKNSHRRAGTDIVLLYASPPNAGQNGLPLKQLIHFARVDVAGNSVASVAFLVEPCRHLATVDKQGVKNLEVGAHALSVTRGPSLESRFEVLEIVVSPAS